MNADGTGQTEFYGNNSWFPTTNRACAEAFRGGEVLAILCGHHSTQSGKLRDRSAKRSGRKCRRATGRAVRETRADRIDSYGQDGELCSTLCVERP